jgi:hypothetical protein
MRRMRWMWRRRLLRTLGTVPYLLNFRPIGYKAFGMRAALLGARAAREFYSAATSTNAYARRPLITLPRPWIARRRSPFLAKRRARMT